MTIDLDLPVTALIVAAGAGRRLPGEVPKGLRPLGGRALYLHSLAAFDAVPDIEDHVLVVPEAYVERVRAEVSASRIGKPTVVIGGGERRQDSVLLGLETIARQGPFTTPSGPSSSERLVAVHDAARPFPGADLIARTVIAARTSGAALPVLPVTDTIRELAEGDASSRCLDRDRLRAAQTPQVARLGWLLEGYRRAGSEGRTVTDEGAALEHAGHPFAMVEGSAANLKVTTPAQLEAAQILLAAGGGGAPRMRVGFGEDRHPLAPRSPGRPATPGTRSTRNAPSHEDRAFVLAGIVLDSKGGPLGHSDADPLCHAIIDALLGAAGEGTIGDLFPDTDPQWKDRPGLDLLGRAVEVLAAKGWRVSNVDAVVIVDAPRLAPHAPRIRRAIAGVLGVDEGSVSVKGKRAEALGFEGDGKGVSCRAVALIQGSGR